MIEASFYRGCAADGSVQCDLCPHACRVPSGEVGICGVRQNVDGILYAANYGEIVDLRFGRIEDHGIYHFEPGCRVLFLGCAGEAPQWSFRGEVAGARPPDPTRWITASEAIDHALGKGCRLIVCGGGNPFLWYEFLLEIARLAKVGGLATALVTRGYVNPEPLETLVPYLDAVSLAVCGQSFVADGEACAGSIPGGALATALRLRGRVHLEINYTTAADGEQAPDPYVCAADWISTNLGWTTPVHLAAAGTPGRIDPGREAIEECARAFDYFEEKLCHLYLVHERGEAGSPTICPRCNAVLIRRGVEGVDQTGLMPGGECASCGLEGVVKC